MADEIDAWLSDQRARAAADARSRERWLRQQAAEEAAFAALLAGLAERATAVVVELANGRRYHGALAAPGADFVALAAEAGHTVMLALSAITSIRLAGGLVGVSPTPTMDGASQVPGRRRLAHALADAAADRPRVSVGLAGGATVNGELRSVGEDVVTLLDDGAGPIYVRLGSVCDVSLFGSG